MREELSKMAEDIFISVGLAENIISVGECTTRLRLNLRDRKKVNVGILNKVEGVLGVVETKEQLQIILEYKLVDKLVSEFIKISKIQKLNNTSIGQM